MLCTESAMTRTDLDRLGRSALHRGNLGKYRPSPLPVWFASDFTSFATTAKPCPPSPARAASIVAFSASRLVWPAMSLMSLRRH